MLPLVKAGLTHLYSFAFTLLKMEIEELTSVRSVK
jgi:hypothetical protein